MYSWEYLYLSTISCLYFMQVVHVSSEEVTMSEPYIPGFLAFREVNFLIERLEAVKRDHPHLIPQVAYSSCVYINSQSPS